MTRLRITAFALCLSLALPLGGCLAGPGDVGSVDAPIVGGTPDPAHPEVVYLYRLDGAACTGAIIAPRVVLTANHCIEGSGGEPASPGIFRVQVGTSRRTPTAEYRVEAVRPVPNAGLNGRQANDVALLILTQDAAERPMTIARESPQGLFGETCRAIGYGQIPTGQSGTKYTATGEVTGVQGGFIFVEPLVCSGDSGGPLVGPDGLVYGVASFIFSPDGRTEPRCGTAPGAYNEIFRHLDFIDTVLEETGTCVPDPELCDGGDNDCDGQVDEGCTPLGSTCSSSNECVGGLCADTSAGMICTSACDPLRPQEGCPPSYFCAADGCDGYCVPGSVGAEPIETECTSHADCATGFCADPGDGVSRCLAPCRGNAGMCLADEACAAAPDDCGGCVARELVFSTRGLGEPCETDGECAGDMVCHEVAGVSECASACGEGDACPERFTCRDALCQRDRTQPVGGVCLDSGDCGDGICARRADDAWCTAECASAEECPRGFDCVSAGTSMVCAPVAGLDGQPCTSPAECVSNICAPMGDGSSICTSHCDADTPCSPGTVCRRVEGEELNLCAAPATEVSGEGCSVGASRESAGGWLWGGLLLVLGVWVRRRRR